ncbi:peptidase MA family metallohydrolase [Aquisphaera insulae]|uniref:peptidase MA family metallohydrolase n=1 Tax=Aquisphaera insulae TaxID=2712864 RepID=UPI0013EAF9FE|nr:hypothetical protein [Aquisphaera insulae]
MRQALSIALLTVLLLASGRAAQAGDSPPALEQARKLLTARDSAGAAQILEEALPSAAAADRPPIVRLLRQAYQELIRDAESSGKASLAAEYRDNLSILEPTSDAGTADPKAGSPQKRPDTAAAPVVAAPVPPPSASPTPVPAPALAPVPSSAPAPTEEPFPPLPGEPAPRRADPGVRLASSKGPQSSPVREPAPVRRASEGDDLPRLSEPPEVPAPVGGSTPPAESPPVPASSTPGEGATANAPRTSTGGDSPAPKKAAPSAVDLADQADRLFTEKRYLDAGVIYTKLAAANRLPSDRKGVWAYCRWVEVVNRINAHPRTDREWDDIQEEVRDVQKLVPGNWYGAYLENLVKDARRNKTAAGGRRAGVVVRGSAPEEQPTRRRGLFGRESTPSPSEPSAAAAAAQPLGLPAAPASAEMDASPPAGSATAPAARSPRASAEVANPRLPRGPASANGTLGWQVIETANFRIFHVDPTLGAEVARTAESVRGMQAKRWGSTATRSTWTPRCDVYLYPDPAAFSRMTGQPETSPGFSSLGVSGDRVTSRRVNLRADHPQLLPAILPHEITHVVLADLFTHQPIPRWADEGIAVLSEPEDEQASRAGDLAAPLRDGSVFKLSELMATDSPNANTWNLYYAQSVSLTQYLVELGTPAQFVLYLKGAQQKGIEASLRETYGIEGFPALESGWRQFAARQVAHLPAEGQQVAAGPESAEAPR